MVDPEFDVVDEAVLDASPERVFEALLDEIRGKVGWWKPMFAARARRPEMVGKVGAVIDVKLGCAFKPRFTARMVEVVTSRRVRVEFFEGDFLGTGDWSFEPVGPRTRVRFRWRVRGNRFVFRVVAPFVDLGRIHSGVVENGFAGLRGHLRATA